MAETNAVQSQNLKSSGRDGHHDAYITGPEAYLQFLVLVSLLSLYPTLHFRELFIFGLIFLHGSVDISKIHTLSILQTATDDRAQGVSNRHKGLRS